MLNGNLPALKPAPNGASAEPSFDPAAFAQFLLTLPNVREVKAALNAILFEITCTARNEFDGEFEESGEELDSGTWFFVRVSDLPSPEARGGLVSFMRAAVVGIDPSGSGQMPPSPACVVVGMSADKENENGLD